MVTETRPRYKIDPDTRKRTNTLEGYACDIIASHGRSQTVKWPLECEETVQKISDLLNGNQLVHVDFGTPSTLRGKCYAMPNNGQILSGVSCTATEINIVKVEDNIDDFDDDLIVE